MLTKEKIKAHIASNFDAGVSPLTSGIQRKCEVTGLWQDIGDSFFTMDDGAQYRIKPEIKAIEMRLPVGFPYFVPNLSNKSLFTEYEWSNDEIDDNHLSRGIAYTTAESAVIRAKQILNLDY